MGTVTGIVALLSAVGMEWKCHPAVPLLLSVSSSFYSFFIRGHPKNERQIELSLKQDKATTYMRVKSLITTPTVVCVCVIGAQLYTRMYYRVIVA